MTVIAVMAGILVMWFNWILLLVLLAIPFVAQRRAPSTEFFCALIGMMIGALFTPAQVNYRPSNDLRDFAHLLGIIGGAFTGGLVGTIIAWTDRRIVSRR